MRLQATNILGMEDFSMANCQVTCITKPNVNSPHEHITHVGNPAWSMKRLTVEGVIQRINS
jgi:hypothetical protein